jgi:hypothetical protein
MTWISTVPELTRGGPDRRPGADVVITGRNPERLQHAALAVYIMTNTALTGATYDIDGGEQIVPG